MAAAWRALTRGRRWRSAAAGYLAMAIVDAAGSGLFLPAAALSLTVLLGIPSTQVGPVLTAATVLALAAGPAAGPLLGRYGARRVLSASLLVRAVSLGCYPVLSGTPAALALTSVNRVASMIGRPALAAAATRITGAGEQVGLLARAHAWRNVAIGAGTVAAGLLLATPTRGAFVTIVAVNALSYALAAALAWTLVPRGGPAGGAGAGPSHPPQGVRLREVLRERTFLRVALGLALLSTQSALLTVALPLWLLARDAERAGVLSAGALALNTLLVATLQVRLSRGAEVPSTAARLLRRSGGLLALGCLCPLAAGGGVVPLALAVLAMTVLVTTGEILLSAGGWGAPLGLAPEGQPEQHLAIAAWAQALGEALAAATVGTLGVAFGAAGWAASAAVFVLAAAVQPRPRRLASRDPCRPPGRGPAPGAPATALPGWGPTGRGPRGRRQGHPARRGTPPRG